MTPRTAWIALVGIGLGALVVGLTRGRSDGRDTPSLREHLRQQMILASRDQAEAYARLDRFREEASQLDHHGNPVR